MGAERHKRICAVSPRHFNLVAMAITVAGLLSGCATQRPLSKSNVDSESLVRVLQRELKRKQLKIDELKERNLVLEKRKANRSSQEKAVSAARVPVPFDPSAAQADVGSDAPASTVAHVASKKILKEAAVENLKTPPPTAPAADTENVGIAQTGEHFLYSKVLETYRKKNLGELQKTLQLLLKTYPDSVFADNALYLAGLLSLEQSNPERASKYMDQVLADYPRGNKAVTALYTKGVIEKRLNRPGSAKDLFHRVRDLYPGSPEAARASIDLKLLELTAGKRRES